MNDTITPNTNNKKRKINLIVPYVQNFSPSDSIFKLDSFNTQIDDFIQKKMKSKSNNLMQTHVVKFIEWNPSAIYAMCINQSEDLLAIGRDDSSIEIRSVEGNRFYKRIPGQKDVNKRITSMIWVKTSINGKSKEILLSAGLNGFISSWDITTMKEIQYIDSFGGSIWSMKQNSDGSRIALACNDGTLRIYEMVEGELIYKSSLKSNNLGGKKKKFFQNQFKFILIFDPYIIML